MLFHHPVEILQLENRKEGFFLSQLGPTPIVRVLRYVLREKQLEIQERKLLLLLATDGVPTNENGKQDIKSLEYVLRHERTPVKNVPVTIIACTDDNDCIGYGIVYFDGKRKDHF